MAVIGQYGYFAAALAFLFLTLLLVTSWRGHLQGGMLVVACLVTAVWAVVTAIFSSAALAEAVLPQWFEVVKNAAWYVFLLRLFYSERAWGLRPLFIGVVLLCSLLLLAYLLIMVSGHVPDWFLEWRVALAADALQAVLGLVILEQLYRNTLPDQRWSIKYLCMGLGAMFTYDFYLYADALLFGGPAESLWQARGLVYTLVVPLIAVSASRNPKWQLDVYVSRQVVFHGMALLSAGIYLLLMAAGGYYIRYYGGTWGGVLQIAFVAGALLVLLVVLSSGHVRAYLRVFLNKHFFNYKYDYRHEWLSFIRKLSALSRHPRWRAQAIKVVADIVDSPGGVLWEKRDGRYELMAHYAMSESGMEDLEQDDALVRFLKARQWVIHLDEFKEDPGRYPGLVLPQWLSRRTDAWVVVPLVLEQDLAGILLLVKPLASQDCTWEDYDILKTAGVQVAAFLVQQQTVQALVSARQFEAANRLSAFMMHDLKNMMAQLSLLVANAEKHRNNPAFVDDMIATVANAVSRMERMLAKLNQARERKPHMVRVDMVSLVSSVVEEMARGTPTPRLEYSRKGALEVRAEFDRLAAVIGHVIRNAQDATPEDGLVRVRLRSEQGQVVVEVEDTGHGMDQDFVRERLFRPFDSTKGSSGMGIGAYECREYVRELGGTVEVESAPGKGTCFRMRLPLLDGSQAESHGLSHRAAG